MFFQLIITWSILYTVASQCVYDYNKPTKSLQCTCENITTENYVYHMDRLNPQIQKDVGLGNTLDIQITFVNSLFKELDKWITLPMTSQYGFWTNSKIFFNFSSCGINSVQPNAFDFSVNSVLYPALDLSFNYIYNVDFLKNTPKLKYLYLRNATDTFYIFKNVLTSYYCPNMVSYIDLSYTNIQTVDFRGYSCFPELDLSYSSIKLIVGPTNINPRIKMNLTNCENLQFINGSSSSTYTSFTNLDLSNINNLDLIILKQSTISNSLNLTNTNLKSIPKQFFSEISIDTLNLAKNNLSVLEEEIFSSARIQEIDLSNSRIFEIKRGCFQKFKGNKLVLSNNNIANMETPFTNATFTELILSYNNISTLENIFVFTTVTSLDLSFNPIQSIDSRTFATCLNLNNLNLANTYIPKIADYTFKSLPALQSLNISISGNFTPEMLENLYLKSLTLSNSNISSLQDGNFKGLYSLEQLYFNNSVIANVAVDALKYLVNVKYLDTNTVLKSFTVIPKGLFKDALSLIYLDLSYLQLDGFEAGAFDGLISLKGINVTGSSLENDFSFISKFVQSK